jgi:signal transduction histidine kinase
LTLTYYALMSAVAAAAGLVLAALAVTRAVKSPLSRPLAILAANQFAWNTATVFYDYTQDNSWRWLSAVVAPLFTPAAWWFVLIFIGRVRALRGATALIWAVYGLQTVAALVLLVIGRTGEAELGALSLVHLACDLPLLVVAVRLISEHARQASQQAERERAWTLIFALVVFVAFVSTDMLHDAGLFPYALAAPGSFFFNGMLFVLTFRMGLYADADRAAGAATTALAVLMVLVGYLGVLAFARDSQALTLVDMAAVTLAMFAFGRFAITSWTSERAGLERMALMGRFSAQMAHDLKNPLAAAHGAAQFLEEEVRQGRGIAQQQEFMTLLIAQLDRLGRLIDRYQKLGKLELARQPLEANALVQRVTALQSYGAHEVKVITELWPQPIAFSGDPMTIIVPAC